MSAKTKANKNAYGFEFILFFFFDMKIRSIYYIDNYFDIMMDQNFRIHHRIKLL